MAVILTSAVEGMAPEETYTGPNEAWLLEQGYAKAVDEDDIPDLDHLVGADWPDEVDPGYEDAPTPSSAHYPEVSPETLIQNTEAESQLERIRSTKQPYTSDPAPELTPEPDPGGGEG